MIPNRKDDPQSAENRSKVLCDTFIGDIHLLHGEPLLPQERKPMHADLERVIQKLNTLLEKGRK